MSQLMPTYGESLLRAHRSLLGDLQTLQAAAQTANPRRPGELVERLGKVRAQLSGHFYFEEHNGYMDAVLERQPHLERVVQHLALEHGALLDRLDELLDEASSAAGWRVLRSGILRGRSCSRRLRAR